MVMVFAGNDYLCREMQERNSLPIAETIFRNLPFTPLEAQRELAVALEKFLSFQDNSRVFILNGYAGTGKTSIMGALVKALDELKIKSVLLAPTGRAAKVFSGFAGKKAFTIHKRIFRGDPLEPGSGFYLAPNKDKNAVFIIDESSMIPDDTGYNASLLQQLLRHIYSSPGCVAILTGDTAQLPPVGQIESPAMNPDRLRSLGFTPFRFTLTEPVRQVKESGILHNATLLRRSITEKIPHKAIEVSSFPDITVVEPMDMEDYLTSSWAKAGMDETILITRSNWRANGINRDVRSRILYAEDELMRDEQLIVTKNNYFWKLPEGDKSDFIANGESLRVNWFGREEKRYGKRFVEAELLTGNDSLLSAKLMLDSLQSEGPNLSAAEMRDFYRRVAADYAGPDLKRSVAARKDPFFNALQVKYAYCVTCHKAQGGQWKHVYIDLAGINPENLGEDYLRWLYTAVTRASERLFLVNPSVPVS